MTGNVGISGAEVSVGTSAGNLVFGGPPLVYPGDRGLHMPEIRFVNSQEAEVRWELEI